MYDKQGKKIKWESVKEVLRKQLGFFDKVEISAEEELQLKAAFELTKDNKQTVETLYKNVTKIADVAVGMLNEKAKLGWTTKAHSAAAVPVFAIGAGAEKFSGWKDNSELMPILLKVSGE